MKRNKVFVFPKIVIKKYGRYERFKTEYKVLKRIRPLFPILIFSPLRNVIIMKKLNLRKAEQDIKKDPELFFHDLLEVHNDFLKLTSNLFRNQINLEFFINKFVDRIGNNHLRRMSFELIRLYSSLELTKIIHGDFGIHNIFVSNIDNKIIPLDYEFARRGHQLEDISYFVYTVLKYLSSPKLSAFIYKLIGEEGDDNSKQIFGVCFVKALFVDSYWNLFGLEEIYNIRGYKNFSKEVVNHLIYLSKNYYNFNDPYVFYDVGLRVIEGFK